MTQAPLMISISGLRGLIGQSLTPSVAAEYAACFGQWLFQHRRPDVASKTARTISTMSMPGAGGGGVTGGGSHVVIGRDSRPSGAMIEASAVAGLLAVGCRVTTLGIATTPAVALMVDELQADGGMVITASHNPIIWNGIKCLRYDGVAPPANQAQQIIDTFHKRQITYAPVEQLQSAQANDQAGQVHLQRILPFVDVAKIRAARSAGGRKFKVVLDSVCGAGGPSTALLLRELGVEVIHLHGEPTGLFPHTPEPTRENLVGLSQAVRAHQADLGFAQDPDADRLALVDDQGRYIGEEYTLALGALHVLSQLGDKARGATLAANLSTSRMIDDIAQKFGATVLRTPVGEANVAAAMREHQSVFGGEGNGGVLWPKVGLVRDSLAGIALVIELLAQRGQPLSQVMNDIPTYAIVKDKVDVNAQALARMSEVMQKTFAGLKLDMQDGVRVDWPNKWVHVRPSNTEPIIRVIAEAGDESQARQLITQVKQAMGV